MRWVQEAKRELTKYDYQSDDDENSDEDDDNDNDEDTGEDDDQDNDEGNDDNDKNVDYHENAIIFSTHLNQSAAYWYTSNYSAIFDRIENCQKAISFQFATLYPPVFFSKTLNTPTKSSKFQGLKCYHLRDGIIIINIIIIIIIISVRIITRKLLTVP